MRILDIKGLPICPDCEEHLWSPKRPNIWDGKWLVLYCWCPGGRCHEYSLQFLLNKGWWPVPQAGRKIEEMFCPNCQAAKVIWDSGTSIIECSECHAKFQVTKDGLMQVFP